MLTVAIPRYEVVLCALILILVMRSASVTAQAHRDQTQNKRSACSSLASRATQTVPTFPRTFTHSGTVSYRVASHRATDPFVAGAISLSYLEPTTILGVSCRVFSSTGTRWHVNADVDGTHFDLGVINSRAWSPSDPRCPIFFETTFDKHTSRGMPTAEELLQRVGKHTIAITLTTDTLVPLRPIFLDEASLVVHRTNITKQLFPIYVPCMPLVGEREICALANVPLPASVRRFLNLQDATMTMRGFRRPKPHPPLDWSSLH